MDYRVLRWLGHVEIIDDCCMTIRVLMEELSGGRVRGRPRQGWIDGVNVNLGSRRRCERYGVESPGAYVDD